MQTIMYIIGVVEANEHQVYIIIIVIKSNQNTITLIKEISFLIGLLLKTIYFSLFRIYFFSLK